ncbi:hypothetical protein SLEP1_g34692 [Rubroshorea leprosula]|uniref:Sulfotransferase n=1 Tax=Rubroshorea leprosula TaxID=152421 RepID=A0AAV5KKU5_9ROSI|nr:hypothetical protein SLEP1_g34692 [Rubroshorea leprosula]
MEHNHLEREEKESFAKEEVQEMISSLPRARGLVPFKDLCQYQGFWVDLIGLEGVILAQQHFQAQPTDIILSSPPKSGTTWLKALGFAIVTRNRYDDVNSPLLTKVSHECVPVLIEFSFIQNKSYRSPDLPLLSTHSSFSCLPKSVITTPGCKIVYICRDPKDTFISMWHYVNSNIPKGSDPFPLEEAVELFCQGLSFRGPYWDHVLEYWNASLELPEKVLFLMYEDIKRDPVFHVKRLAEFMGYPFTLEEESRGMVQKVVELCSFEKLSNLEVNKTGKYNMLDKFEIENRSFFRKGAVGDWKNYLTPEMAARFDQISEQKWKASGLSFNVTSS